MFPDNSIISKISKGEYPTREFKTKYGVFTIKYPSGREFQEIARKKAGMFGGMPLESFDLNFARVAQRDATLSIVISSYPKEIDIKYQGDDFVDFPDEEVKNLIYKEFNIFYLATQEEISGKSSKKN